MTQHASYGEVHGPRAGEISRRSFMRRMLGVGIGIMSLEFLGGTFAFLWPNVTEGLGSEIEIGTAEGILANQPEWANGLPYVYQPANLFIVNVPAGKARVEGNGTVAQPVPDPGAEVLALWRKCPHLGCQVPQLCGESQWFECLCHGSKYTILGEKRDGPAPRGMDRFPTTLNEAGVYVVDTRAVESGPPPGTVTFDERLPNEIPHCAG
ncbi:MAG: ubiquinol-cytochrome c reductase iron-sulfur subunit [Candidatus Limnocylindria bacterium]